MESKQNTILVIADCIAAFENEVFGSKYDEADLAQALWQLRKTLGADKLILASTAVSPKGYYFDGLEEKTYYNVQSFIEGYYHGKAAYRDDASFMGPCFYKDGYAVLSKEKGFGNYELIHHDSTTPRVTKVSEYIKRLSEEDNITCVVRIASPHTDLLDTPVIDETLLSALSIPLCTITSASALKTVKRQKTIVEENSFHVTSKQPRLDGTVDCLKRLDVKLKQMQPQLIKKEVIE